MDCNTDRTLTIQFDKQDIHSMAEGWDPTIGISDGTEFDAVEVTLTEEAKEYLLEDWQRTQLPSDLDDQEGISFK